ncbi:MAG TPA: hypothetical protein PKE40_10640 [Arachnia sp.]|nr:hypothetical protein [Arachnia sp.]HMT86801.1 hypothetical protein [Arachnia sp.]
MTSPARPGAGRTPGSRAHRVAALFAYDGWISAALLRAFQFFLVAVSFLVCLAPLALFHALVGWQPTHLALWLGAAAVLPVVPATYGALDMAQRVLLVSGGSGAGRGFWRSFATATRSLWWLAAAVSGAVLVIGYDLALLGSSDAVFLVAVLAIAALVVLVVGVCSVAPVQPAAGPRVLMVAAVRAIAARPHIALCWLLLSAVGVAAAFLPLIGGAVALFAPALVACAITICNVSLRFGTRRKGVVS